MNMRKYSRECVVLYLTGGRLAKTRRLNAQLLENIPTAGIQTSKLKKNPPRPLLHLLLLRPISIGLRVRRLMLACARLDGSSKHALYHRVVQLHAAVAIFMRL